jgi:predicted transcriptional regulator
MARAPILEKAVMELLWDTGEPLTPREVKERLPEVSSLAYTTVMTVLARLWKKGRLERRRVGRAYAYQPAIDREHYTAAQMEHSLGLVADRPAVLNYFIESLTREDQEQLRKILGRG